LFVTRGGKTLPSAGGIAEFGNDDPMEDFVKCDVRHAVQVQNSEGSDDNKLLHCVVKVTKGHQKQAK